jgi:DNA mismatch endonuclease (patch repair protein)
VKKLDGNAARDRRNALALRRAGWRVIVVWECETEREERLRARIMKALTVQRGARSSA